MYHFHQQRSISSILKENKNSKRLLNPLHLFSGIYRRRIPGNSFLDSLFPILFYFSFGAYFLSHRNCSLEVAKSTVQFKNLILLDISVSFDPVDHPLILEMYSSLGSQDTTPSWIFSHLLDYSFTVSFADPSSSSRTVNV